MKIRFSIAPDFCREQFLAGYEVAPHYEMECPLGALTPSERQFIVSTYPPEIEGVIYDMLLEVPIFDPEQNAIVRAPWQCRINPDNAGARGIIKEWMKDYTRLESENEVAQQQTLPSKTKRAKPERAPRYKHH